MSAFRKPFLPLLLALAAFLASAPSHAVGDEEKNPIQQPGCAGPRQLILNSLKSIASLGMEGIGDDSAPRAALREAKETNARLTIALMLDIMRDMKCTMPKGALTHSWYMLQAAQCGTAMATVKLAIARGERPDPLFPPACDSTQWTATQEALIFPPSP